jgi:branched-chain amino acid transport system ATP-binding protein
VEPVPARPLAASRGHAGAARLVGLAPEARETAGELSYGKQKQLELAIALASQPRLLLLDEPTAGMSPQETGETIASVRDIVKARGLTLLFTEHDMSVVFGIAERISVLHHGEIIASGAPDAVRNDPEVRRVYLGEHAHGMADLKVEASTPPTG